MGGVQVGLLVLNFVMAIISAAVGASKGRSALGFLLFGLLFWPGALITALIISPLDPDGGLKRANQTSDQGNRLVVCAECGAKTPLALSFCTSCRAPRAAG